MFGDDIQAEQAECFVLCYSECMFFSCVVLPFIIKLQEKTVTPYLSTEQAKEKVLSKDVVLCYT